MGTSPLGINAGRKSEAHLLRQRQSRTDDDQTRPGQCAPSNSAPSLVESKPTTIDPDQWARSDQLGKSTSRAKLETFVKQRVRRAVSNSTLTSSATLAEQRYKSGELKRARWPNEHDQRSQSRIQTSETASATKSVGRKPIVSGLS
ncbi:hypothetical protein U1Q18_026339 [Sarracenia purpurea var. burkii]